MTVAAAERPWINLGCGRFPLEGYINVDMHEASADVRGDVWGMSFRDCGVVKMDHFLEHFGHGETQQLLALVKGWLAPGGIIEVEVPDMDIILMNGTTGDWLRYVYGSQQHEGEYHKSGFTVISLFDALEDAGFHDVKCWRFVSEFQTRPGMPCLRGTGRA